MSEHRASSEEPTLFETQPASAEERQEQVSAREAAEGGRSKKAQASASGGDEALTAANERADRLEAEMAELKSLVQTLVAGREGRPRTEGTRGGGGASGSRAARVKQDAAKALANAVHGDETASGDTASSDTRSEEQGATSERSSGGREMRHGAERSPDAETGAGASGGRGRVAASKGGVPVRDGSSSGDSAARREARARVDAGDDASASKEPPSPSSAAGEPGVGGGEAELRKDGMMAHLMDSLEAGEDIGHYGRLTFAMIARHFLPHDEVVGWMLKDEDLTEEEAEQMLTQVEDRDYSPPRRDRILQWQSEQEFPILPEVDDPDSGNVYRTLNFPKEIYDHIGHYREQKAEAHE